MSQLILREQDRKRLVELLAAHLPAITAWAYGSVSYTHLTLPTSDLV